jgi:Ca2+-binding EF-hand superfamily protein
MQQSTSVTITKVVEKRTNQPTKVTTTAVSSSKPVTQVVNNRSHTTTSISPNKPGTTQVVRSQVVTTSVSSNKPGTTSTQVVNNRRTQQTTTTTTSTTKSPGKPVTTTTQAVNKRNQNSTQLKTSVSPSRQVTSTAKVVDNRPHKTVPVKAPPKETNQLQVVDRRSHQSSSNANSKSGSRAASKGPSKAPSQAPTKKVEAKKVISYSSTDGGERIKEAFELFDSNEGKIDAKEVKEAMVNIGYDEKNPVVYQVVTELDTPRNNNAGGASFEDFCQTVNNRLPDKETDDDLRRIFNLFVDDPDSDTTSLESIKRVADELGENIEEGELNAMLNKASKAGSRLTFEDFVSIMKENF